MLKFNVETQPARAVLAGNFIMTMCAVARVKPSKIVWDRAGWTVSALIGPSRQIVIGLRGEEATPIIFQDAMPYLTVRKLSDLMWMLP